MSQPLSNQPRYWCVVPAAGTGSRFGADIPKQYAHVCGRSIAEHTLNRLLGLPWLQRVVVAVHRADTHWPLLAVSRAERVQTVVGGQARAQSVLAGLQALFADAQDDDWVLVHDIARPCVTEADIDQLVSTLGDDPVGGLLAVPASDTLKQADPEQRVAATVDRAQLWHALTPQLFRYALLRDSLERALAAGATVTDEASAVEWAGRRPHLVPGRRDNLKITLAEDLALAEVILRRQETP